MGDLNAFHIGTVDQILVIAYLFGVLFVGLRFAKSYRNDVDDYLLMGRKLSLPASLQHWFQLGTAEFSELANLHIDSAFSAGSRKDFPITFARSHLPSFSHPASKRA